MRLLPNSVATSIKGDKKSQVLSCKKNKSTPDDSLDPSAVLKPTESPPGTIAAFSE
jgi:hypothetical protein